MGRVKAGVLEIAYEETGPAQGTPVVLLHGFPYDVHAYDEVSLILAARGCRVIVPYLRGYGPTRFLSASTPRSGQQAALGHDLLALLDALSIPAAVLAGYDWGGRAACVVAALWPERARGLVSCGGYNIQDIAASATPRPPEDEYRHWYQSYRHRFRLAEGDPAYEASERRLATRPQIVVISPRLALEQRTGLQRQAITHARARSPRARDTRSRAARPPRRGECRARRARSR